MFNRRAHDVDREFSIGPVAYDASASPSGAVLTLESDRFRYYVL